MFSVFAKFLYTVCTHTFKNQNPTILPVTDECFEEYIDYKGNDIAKYTSVATPEDCQVKCQHNDKCKYWTYGHITENQYWYAGHCFLKNAKSNLGPKAALTSGPRNCPSKYQFLEKLSSIP